jgi:alpha-tubulin suppressor-like RCC1 family protein
MSLTKITDEVIALSTISFDKLTEGGPRWSSSGVISATGFVGDGSELSNLFPAASVIEVNDSLFTILPEHDNATLVFNNGATVDIDFVSDYKKGHKTALFQNSNDPLVFSGLFRNVDGLDRTKGLYSKSFVQFVDPFNGWTLYGDLTGQFIADTTGNDGKATRLAAGFGHSLVLAGNALYATGDNQYGQLGTGDVIDRTTFARLSGSWTSISAGDQHSFALSGSKLFAVGRNDGGQLGLGNNINRSTFTQVPGDWTAIAAGAIFSFALSGTDLYATGINTRGELGLGDTMHRSTFTQVPGDWIDVSAGGTYCFALSGTDLYATGWNSSGQLGLGDTVDKSTFTKVSGKWTSVAAGRQGSSFALSGDDLYACGENDIGGMLGLGNTIHRSTFTKVPGKWTAIFEAGSNHSLALSGTELYTAGYTKYSGTGVSGGLGESSTFTKISGNWLTAANGSQHVLALSASNALFSTGENPQGQLGLGDLASRSTFTRVSGVYIEYSAPATPSFTQIAAGVNRNYYALSGTSLYACGSNGGGELGLGNTISKSTFTKIPGTFNSIYTGGVALSSGSYFVVGANVFGELGLGDLNSRSTFTKMIGGNWSQVFKGQGYITFALSGTDLYSTGQNGFGGLGLNDINDRSTFTKIVFPTNAKWTSASCYYLNSLALSGTDLYAVGDNGNGQLGLNDRVHRSTFTKVVIPANAKWSYVQAAQSSSYALSGTDLYVCGDNFWGTLGLNDTLPRSTFTKVTSLWNGSSFISNPKFDIVVANANLALALSGGDLYGCGSNAIGQLGLNDTSPRSLFTRIAFPPISCSAIQPGSNASLGLFQNKLYVTGSNDQGQLGLNDIQNRSTFTQVTAVG